MTKNADAPRAITVLVGGVGFFPANHRADALQLPADEFVQLVNDGCRRGGAHEIGAHSSIDRSPRPALDVILRINPKTPSKRAEPLHVHVAAITS